VLSKAQPRLTWSLLVYAIATALCLAAMCIAFRLAEADLQVPLYYTEGGDVHFHLALFKTVTETGWFLTNPNLGAPGVMELHDFPYAETGLFLAVRALALFTSDPFLIANLIFLGSFPIVCWSALFVMRSFGISDAVAVVASLLFTFAPYHLWRGMAHPHLSAYYSVPLTVMLALWLWRGVPLAFRGKVPPGSGGSTARPVVTVLAALLISLSGPYYAVFGLLILSIAGLVGMLRRPRRDRVLDAALVLGIVGVSFALQIVPFLSYRQAHGANPRAMFRPGVGVLLTSLRIDTMIVPVPGHPIFPTYDPMVRALSDGQKTDREPAQGRRYIERLASHSLGTIGTLGLCALLAAGLGWPVRAFRPAPSLRDLGQLAIAILLLGVNGGFGELLSLSLIDKLRNLDRLEIYVEFLALFAVAFLADSWWARSRKGIGLLLPLGVVLVLGLLDQVSPLVIPVPAREAKAFASDREFVARIEDALPPGSLVFQLPPNSFPEFGGHFQMNDYNLFRGYFHSHKLHWSFGAMRGREVEKWQSGLAPLPPQALVRELRSKGFAGLYINRLGHEKRAGALEQALSQELHQSPIVSQDGELSFYSL
jgi:phosphoglycerol transferase